ncbi:MAG: hypothetical protein RSC33_00590 [Vagococcus sp.]
MGKIEIIKNYINSFPELRAKKEPRKLKDKDKYEKNLKEWEIEERRKSNLRQVKHTYDNSLIGGSAFRAIRYDNIDNLLGEDTFVLGEGEGHPNFERIFNTLPEATQVVRLNINDLVKVVEVVSKAVSVTRVTISDDKILFEPKYRGEGSVFEESFNQAQLKLETEVSYFPIEFLINPTYLVSMLKFAKKLKIKELDLHYVSEIRPLLFVGVDDSNFNHIIMPLR